MPSNTEIALARVLTALAHCLTDCSFVQVVQETWSAVGHRKIHWEHRASCPLWWSCHQHRCSASLTSWVTCLGAEIICAWWYPVLSLLEQVFPFLSFPSFFFFFTDRKQVSVIAKQRDRGKRFANHKFASLLSICSLVKDCCWGKADVLDFTLLEQCSFLWVFARAPSVILWKSRSLVLDSQAIRFSFRPSPLLDVSCCNWHNALCRIYT